MREWMIRHPQAVALALAVWATWAVLEAFDAGREIGAARALRGEADRLASEAMGG